MIFTFLDYWELGVQAGFCIPESLGRQIARQGFRMMLSMEDESDTIIVSQL